MLNSALHFTHGTLQARINLPTTVDVKHVSQVRFEAVRGVNDESGIAVDDIYLKNGTCENCKCELNLCCLCTFKCR